MLEHPSVGEEAVQTQRAATTASLPARAVSRAGNCVERNIFKTIIKDN